MPERPFTRRDAVELIILGVITLAAVLAVCWAVTS